MVDKRPILYDLFCGAGGAAMGYYRAGFEVIGIDNKPQKNYPFKFIQMDALEFLQEVIGGKYPTPAAIHASPPCQAYSIMRNLPWLRNKEYPQLIDPTRESMEMIGRPWIIENVMGARLPAGWLCGTAVPCLVCLSIGTGPLRVIGFGYSFPIPAMNTQLESREC